MNDGDPRGRWRYQRQRVADVLTQHLVAREELDAVERYGSREMRDQVLRAREARIAAGSNLAIDDPVQLARAARIVRAALERRDHIRRVVDQAPPLSPEQRDRLAMLLRPVGGNQ